jgi:hypothetical protein
MKIYFQRLRKFQSSPILLVGIYVETSIVITLLGVFASRYVYLKQIIYRPIYKSPGFFSWPKGLIVQELLLFYGKEAARRRTALMPDSTINPSVLFLVLETQSHISFIVYHFDVNSLSNKCAFLVAPPKNLTIWLFVDPDGWIRRGLKC